MSLIFTRYRLGCWDSRPDGMIAWHNAFFQKLHYVDMESTTAYRVDWCYDDTYKAQ